MAPLCPVGAALHGDRTRLCLPVPVYARYVAIGDSSTEGLDDPDGRGGWIGWGDRLAAHVAASSPGLEYANLAVRGRLAGQVRAEQLPVAVAMRPDLASVFAGVNDVLRPGFDPAALAADLEAMLRALVEAGATVVTITVPDPGSVMPVARPLRPRIARFNDLVREVAGRTGSLLADVGGSPVAHDPRLWSEDRLHANTLGHTRIAAALAEALQLPGSDHSWADPLPPRPRPGRHEVARAELAWTRRHLLPWIGRRLRGRSSGDGVEPKRPVPAPYRPAR